MLIPAVFGGDPSEKPGKMDARYKLSGMTALGLDSRVAAFVTLHLGR
jgi:hypothetical protein